MREHSFDLDAINLTPQTFDAVIPLTDHTDFDYEMTLEHAPILVDTRGKFRVMFEGLRGGCLF